MIRRIDATDIDQVFYTGNRAFDFLEDGTPCNLLFYFLRDQSGDYKTFVLEDEGVIEAVLCLQIKEDHIYLSRLGVKENCTGKGHSRELHAFLLRRAIGEGMTEIILLTQEKTVPFFQEFGWKVIEWYDDPHWGGICARMGLSLRAFFRFSP